MALRGRRLHFLKIMVPTGTMAGIFRGSRDKVKFQKNIFPLSWPILIWAETPDSHSENWGSNSVQGGKSLLGDSSVFRRLSTGKKFNFWWSLPQKWTSTGHFGARDDPTIRISKNLKAIKVIEAVEVLRSGKSLLRTSESSRFLNSVLISCFEEDLFW